jgi:hypothetical protein
MTATLAEVRTAIADTLSARLPGVNAYRLPVDNPSAPCAIVAGRVTNPDTMDGSVTDVWDVYVAVSHRNVDQVDDLDALTDQTGDGSAVAALRADPSLGGVVMAAVVTTVGDYRELTMGDVSYYAATVTVEVMR